MENKKLKKKKKKRRKKKVTKDWLGKWLYINRADIAHGKIILFKQDWNLDVDLRVLQIFTPVTSRETLQHIRVKLNRQKLKN